MDNRPYGIIQTDTRLIGLIDMMDYKQSIQVYGLDNYTDDSISSECKLLFQGKIYEFIVTHNYKEKYCNYIVDFIGISLFGMTIVIKPDIFFY